MPIKKTSPNGQAEAFIEGFVKNKIQSLIDALVYVGLECVREARLNRRYTDQTGNLRSSVGFCVLYNGRVVKKSAFEAVKSSATEGSSAGSKFLKSLISENSRGIVLIVVAGMNYAKYVEAMGLNVLDSSELLAKKLVPQLLKDLGFK